MKQTVIWCVVLVLFAAAAGPALLAQDVDNNIARIYVVHVKNGMESLFEAGFRAHLEWRKAQGEPWNWTTYQIVNGENLGDYIIRSGSHTWADLDAYEDFLVNGTPHFYASVGASMESIDSYITATDQKALRLPEDFSKVNYLAYQDYHLSFAEAFAFQSSIHKIHEIIENANWPVYYAWTSAVNGGSGPAVTLVSFHENWASMQEPEKDFFEMLDEAVGEEEAGKLLGAFTDAVKWVDSSIGKRRPDLSIFLGE